ncbi:MAG: hypothetical protein ACRDY3_09720, partial [Acidimicrobiales bacterium]
MTDLLRALLESSATFLADVEMAERGDERILVRSDRTGTMQLYEHESGHGLVQVTALDDPVAVALYVPGEHRAVIEVDAGGDEHHQLYLVDLDRPRPIAARDDLEALTDAPPYGHRLAGISPSGQQAAYLSNCRNG